MTAPYEAEVRVPLPHIDEFRARLTGLGARLAESYSFTDYYYQPRRSRWSPTDRTVRIREHATGHAEVLFSRITLMTEGGVTFKRSALAQGKARLGEGTVEECRALLDDLGFVPWLTVRKLAGELIEIPGVGTIACEDIEGRGWWLELEVEGADPAEASSQLKTRLAALGIDPTAVSPLPMAALMAPPPGRRAYFCGAIRGGRRLQARYARLIAAMEADGWTVLTAHVGAPDVLDEEERDAVSPAQIYRRDMAWLAEADIVVADVTIPSLGVGIELATALDRGAPVIALVEEGTSLSALVGGDDRISLVWYQTDAAAVTALRRALAVRTT